MSRKLAVISLFLLLCSAFLLLAKPANALIIPDLSMNPLNPTAGRVGKTFDVNVTITDVTSLYAYEFKVGYNATLLQVLQVHNGTFFPLPPKSFVVRNAVNNTEGTLWFAVSLLAPELAKSGSGVLATIRFNATYGTLHPETAGCALHIYDVKLSDPNANAIVPNIIDGHYTFVPLRGDINGDGKVDILDIVLITLVFGSEQGDPNWDPRADLKVDNVIDIFDVVLAATNYGAVG